MEMTTCTLKIGVNNLFYCKRWEIRYCSCLSETFGFPLDETLFKSLSFHDFHFKSILKERGRSCNHKSYFYTRELFFVFILIALNTLKFEETGVHLWIVKMKFFSSYRPLKYSTFQLYSYSPIDEKQQWKT